MSGVLIKQGDEDTATHRDHHKDTGRRQLLEAQEGGLAGPSPAHAPLLSAFQPPGPGTSTPQCVLCRGEPIGLRQWLGTFVQGAHLGQGSP